MKSRKDLPIEKPGFNRKELRRNQGLLTSRTGHKRGPSFTARCLFTERGAFWPPPPKDLPGRLPTHVAVIGGRQFPVCFGAGPFRDSKDPGATTKSCGCFPR